ncbi:DUF1934 domain-containing protein [Paenibacillus larvae]|uniref:DUF1934 domain-containing protein n=1 Tax=Paenibacillus larvae TaxID=1464 RepID=UPI001F3269AB|nr:DUF1934 domain-containing protein [Paenibacillus larvae]MDT2192639.1 DUF1934 domain-containing protein [Paenibacillus larvae]MDT2235869.1 DUF1934 domain-containing protein [Paenibacillus larvae]MDT2263135.1 DUF1934 domain-containing protein [Paenibacillus larvae]MDT2293140.1 DUF1934 domain-containing protein [Paenibacillus larvae]
MTSKKQVLVRIDSRQDGHNLIQRVSGELFFKGRQIYLRYREPSLEMGNTLTTVKIGGRRSNSSATEISVRSKPLFMEEREMVIMRPSMEC